jgi:hypothetical protein
LPRAEALFRHEARRFAAIRGEALALAAVFPLAPEVDERIALMTVRKTVLTA